MSDHDALRDNAGAWVLGALDEEEAWRFSAHLEVCASCRDEVTRLRTAADALPLASPPAAPPPALKKRLMAIVEEEAREQAAPAPRALPGWLRALSARPALAAAAATLLIVAGGAIGFAVHGEGGPEARTVALTAAPGVRAQLVQTADGSQLRVTNMPAPPRGRIYQVWLQRGNDEPQPDAVFTVDRQGRGAVGVRGDVGDADLVLVTSEPAGGSTVPSGAPIMRGRLA